MKGKDSVDGIGKVKSAKNLVNCQCVNIGNRSSHEITWFCIGFHSWLYWNLSSATI